MDGRFIHRISRTQESGHCLIQGERRSHDRGVAPYACGALHGRTERERRDHSSRGCPLTDSTSLTCEAALPFPLIPDEKNEMHRAVGATDSKMLIATVDSIEPIRAKRAAGPVVDRTSSMPTTVTTTSSLSGPAQAPHHRPASPAVVSGPRTANHVQLARTVGMYRRAGPLPYQGHNDQEIGPRQRRRRRPCSRYRFFHCARHGARRRDAG
jgi:hypothetical protein